MLNNILLIKRLIVEIFHNVVLIYLQDFLNIAVIPQNTYSNSLF